MRWVGILVAFASASCVGNPGERAHDRWYHEPCYSDDDCNPMLTCEHPMCTARCTSSADCDDRFEYQSYCAIDGWCRSACTTIADCPENSSACTEGTCVPRSLPL